MDTVKAKRHFYGFEYSDGKHTRVGNTKYIAGSLRVFETEESLNEWLKKPQTQRTYGGKERVSRLEAIKMLGMEQFKEQLDYYEWNKYFEY